MKISSTIFVALGIFPLAVFSEHAFGESPQPAPTPPKQQAQTQSNFPETADSKERRPGPEHGGMFKYFFRGMDALSESERQQLRAAVEKARNDAEVVRLRESADKVREQLRGAMREALLRADPSLEPVLNKMRESIQKKLREGDRGRENSHRKRLPEDVRKRLDAAREKAKTYPLVTEARTKLDAATSPLERSAAAKELRAAYRKVILNIDPTLEPYVKPLDRRDRKDETNLADEPPGPNKQ